MIFIVCYVPFFSSVIFSENVDEWFEGMLFGNGVPVINIVCCVPFFFIFMENFCHVIVFICMFLLFLI